MRISAMGSISARQTNGLACNQRPNRSEYGPSRHSPPIRQTIGMLRCLARSTSVFTKKRSSAESGRSCMNAPSILMRSISRLRKFLNDVCPRQNHHPSPRAKPQALMVLATRQPRRFNIFNRAGFRDLDDQTADDMRINRASRMQIVRPARIMNRCARSIYREMQVRSRLRRSSAISSIRRSMR